MVFNKIHSKFRLLSETSFIMMVVFYSFFCVCKHDFFQMDCSILYKPGTFLKGNFSFWYLKEVIFRHSQQFFEQ